MGLLGLVECRDGVAVVFDDARRLELRLDGAADQTSTVFEIETAKLRWPLTGCGGPERRFRVLIEQAKKKFAAVAPKRRRRRLLSKAEIKRTIEAGGKIVLPDGSTIIAADDQTNTSATNSWDRVLGQKNAPD